MSTLFFEQTLLPNSSFLDMTKELPLFPLNIVAFPGELLNLHVFEPRYKQLVSDCMAEKMNFGIPAYVENNMHFGTEVEILQVDKVYSDGRMDIRTKGRDIFKIESFEDAWRGKLYAGGEITILNNNFDESEEVRNKMFYLAQELFKWLQMSEKFKIDETSTSYTIAHKVGLKVEEEYKFLQILNEDERQHFLIDHLSRLIPALERAHSAREIISMNGHFKHLTPPKF